jgi:hypothetical protein
MGAKAREKAAFEAWSKKLPRTTAASKRFKEYLDHLKLSPKVYAQIATYFREAMEACGGEIEVWAREEVGRVVSMIAPMMDAPALYMKGKALVGARVRRPAGTSPGVAGRRPGRPATARPHERKGARRAPRGRAR